MCFILYVVMTKLHLFNFIFHFMMAIKQGQTPITEKSEMCLFLHGKGTFSVLWETRGAFA